MMEPSDMALIRGRRLFLLRGCLLSSLFAAGGIAIVLLENFKLPGYLIAVFFGLCTVGWVGFLLLPTEDLLEMPASFFHWIAPSDVEIRDRLSRAQGTAKPPHAGPEPLFSKAGIWDRELDGSL